MAHTLSVYKMTGLYGDEDIIIMVNLAMEQI